MNDAETNKVANLIEQGKGYAKAGQTHRAAMSFTDAGDLLLRRQRINDAADCFRSALQLNPQHDRANAMVGLLAWEHRQWHEAEQHARRALASSPECGEAHQVLGLVALSCHRIQEGIACCRRALEIQPDLVLARNHLAVGLSRLGQTVESLVESEQGLLLEPANPHAHFSRATNLLTQGRYQEGWLEYEWRFRTGQVGRPPIPRPRWDGSPLNGRGILIHTEQGKGDVFQFIRFLPMVKHLGGRVVLACDAIMRPVLERCDAIDDWFPINTAAPVNFDLHVPLLSLPGLLGIRLDNIPANVPYVFPDPQRVARWQPIIKPFDGFKIGICWQGSPTFVGDQFRSIPLEEFIPLAHMDGIQLFSLQKLDGVDQLESSSQLPVVQLEGLDDTGGAFEDTAAVMQHLDLVISSDTACLHLAGAMGVPAWAALSKGADWRWLRNRSDSPWYPTLRLFRQPELGDWKSVFHAIMDALQHRDAKTPMIDSAQQATPSPSTDAFEVGVSAGELIDKITILEIKRGRIEDPQKVANVEHEWSILTSFRDESLPHTIELDEWTKALKQINEELWNIEDSIRECERNQEFGPRFIELARSVYQTNDRRADLKKRINQALGSSIVEVKSYEEY